MSNLKHKNILKMYLTILILKITSRSVGSTFKWLILNQWVPNGQPKGRLV